MLRIMLDTAPNDPSLLPGAKRPKFLNNHLTLSSKIFFIIISISLFLILSDSLYSPEITEAAARSNFPSIGQRNPPIIPQYPSVIASANGHESIITTPQNDRFQSNTSKLIIPYLRLFRSTIFSRYTRR
jgi:hypothetical protein